MSRCERCDRPVASVLPTSDAAQAIVDDVMRASRPRAKAQAVLPTLDEQTIRADATRAERMRIAKFVRAGDQDPGGMRVAGWSRWSNHTGARIADAIERGEHAGTVTP